MSDLDDALVIAAMTNDAGEADEWSVLLSATAVPHRVVDRLHEPLTVDDDGVGARFCLVVSAEDRSRAQALVDVHREEEAKRMRREQAARAAIAGELERPEGAFAAAACLVGVLVLIYLRAPGFDSPWAERLAVDGARALQGEWWRLVAAAYLHADVGHLFSNVSFLLPLGYLAARRLGAGFFLLGFALSAALGNAVSAAVHGANFHSLGASGGAFGVFGLLVGHALVRAPVTSADPRQRRRELYGAALALVGMTAFAARSDMVAHVAGLGWGVLLGALVRRPLGLVPDTLLGGLAVLLSWAAFARGLAS